MTANFVDPTLLQARYPGFTCCKTHGPIHYRHRWLRDALIRMALDPLVRAMWPGDLAPALPGITFSFMVIRSENPALVTVSEHPVMITDDPGEAVTHIGITRDDLRGPAAVAGRDIWRHKNQRSDPAARMKAIALVRDAGSQLSLAAVVGSVPMAYPLALSTILSMLANGYLQMDISRGLDLDLHVSLGPSALLGESKFQPFGDVGSGGEATGTARMRAGNIETWASRLDEH